MNQPIDIISENNLYFHDINSCKSHYLVKKNTNKRYKFFCQTHFTAGDYDQFNLNRDFINGSTPFKNINNNKLFSKYKFNFYKKFISNSSSVNNTFKYIFNKFKKGIFVKIRDNKIVTFLPFSKVNFINEWNMNIKLDKKWNNYEELFTYVNKIEGYTFHKKHINNYSEQWYGNNFLFRYEFPINENDSGIHQIHDMLIELCRLKSVPDIEFFINKRDFPLLRNDETESYEELFPNNTKIISHLYDSYSPILSMSSTQKHADIPIPTWEDWTMISNIEDNKYFKKPCKNYNYTFNHDWKTKKPIAVFRGSSTGHGIDINTNLRLKVSYISQIQKPTYQNNQIIDAGITSWNIRPRVVNSFVDTINVESTKITLSEFMSPIQQSNYKYIINIDGHSSAYRLSLELGMGSVILLVDSKYKLWIHQLLKPYIHYVPVKNDLSNLEKQIKWCINNDDKCKKIAQNNIKFYKKYISKDSMLNFMQSLLISLKKHSGFYIYNYKNIFDYYLEKQKTILAQYKSNLKYEILNEESKIKFIKYNTNTCILKTKCDNRNREFINEIFILMNAINKLTDKIPNFSKLIAFDDDHMIIKNINGITFDTWLRNHYNFTDYISILSQITLALLIAQEKYGFIHYDLYPWNIMIKTYDSVQKITYKIKNRDIIINTKIIPVIIDYGRSTIIHDNMQYGIVKLFNYSSIHDIITILISSINTIIIKHNLDKYNIKLILKLSEFIANNNYVKRNTIDSIGFLKKFTSNAKKFNEMLYSDKHELNNLTIYDFLTFLSQFNKSIKNIYYEFRNKSNICFDEYTFSNPEKVIKILKTFNNKSNNLLYNCNKNQFIHNINVFMKNDYKILKENGINVDLYESIFEKIHQYIIKLDNF